MIDQKNEIILNFIDKLNEGNFLNLEISFDLLSSTTKIIKNNLNLSVHNDQIIKIFSNFFEFKNKENAINLILKNVSNTINFLNKIKLIKIENDEIIPINNELIDILSDSGFALIFLKEISLKFKDSRYLSNSLKKILYFFTNEKYNNEFVNSLSLFNNEFINEFENLEITNKQMATINLLKEFGVINNITNEEKLIKLITENKNGYVGFDPTAESLHLGNYVMINTLNRLIKSGLNIFPVVGGATGMIGDPSGKSTERTLLNEETILKNKEKIKNQLLKFTLQNEVLDNYDNFKNMSFLSFLRDIGKHVSINYLLEKEIIKSRLNTGISFTEFTYTIMQGYDFLCFYKTKNISLQIGGSDQWGNITTGIEMIRKMHSENNTASGFTINLLTKSDGSKFGKSEKGAIFLDPSLTTPYEMYQFLVNQADDDLIKLLVFLTNISEYHLSIIKELISNNSLLKFRIPQSILAYKLIVEIHSIDEYQQIIRINNSLFKGSINELTIDDLDIVYKIIPNAILSKNDEYELYDLLVKTKICSSNREARESISNNSISINGTKHINHSLIISIKDSLYNKYTLIKKGKKNYFIIKWD